MHFAPNFARVSSVKPGLGDTFAFWTDKWRFMDSSEPLSSRFPWLFSFVLDKDLSAAEVYAAPNMSQSFYLPLSAQAYQEFMVVQQGMIDFPLSVALMFGYMTGGINFSHLDIMQVCMLIFWFHKCSNGFGNLHV
jgi:hypothetical protein